MLAKNQYFSRELQLLLYQACCCSSQDFRKKNIHFLQFQISLPWARKQKVIILPSEKYLKSLKDMIIGIIGTQLCQLFTIFQCGEIMAWRNMDV